MSLFLPYNGALCFRSLSSSSISGRISIKFFLTCRHHSFECCRNSSFSSKIDYKTFKTIVCEQLAFSSSVFNRFVGSEFRPSLSILFRFFFFQSLFHASSRVFLKKNWKEKKKIETDWKENFRKYEHKSFTQISKWSRNEEKMV